MKSFSQIISLILILLITIAIVILLWGFISGTFTSLISSGESTVNETLVTISSCMKIESVSRNKVYVKNCGQGSITNDTLKIYLNNVLLNFTMSPSVVNEDEVGTVSLYNLWELSVGGYLLKVTNPKVITERAVEVVLPDSCVLALDFDEGSGITAKDSSRYRNDGTLKNGTDASCFVNGACPDWVDGKFGKALEFDGGDYVNVSDDDSLDISDEITISVWVNRTNVGTNRVIVIKGNNDYDLYTQGGTILWYITNITGGPDGVIYKQYGGLTHSVWHHIVAIYKSDGTMKLFLDGNELTPIQEFGNPGGLIRTSSYNLAVGSWFSGITTYFMGTIDELRIYNKVLTPDELISLKPVKYY